MNLDELKRLAEAATAYDDSWPISAAFQQRNAWDVQTSDYLEAAHPQAILELIERVQRAEGLVDEFASHLDGCSHGYADDLWDRVQAALPPKEQP